MRHAFAAALVLLSSLSLGQTAANQAGSSQTARQALIEMFFGETPNHMEKHLPEVTRRSLNKFSGGGANYLSEFSMLASQIRRDGTKLETFDTGPMLVSAQDPRPSGNGPDKIEISVERDDLIGDEDQIELALHLSRNGKEQDLPVIPRFTFSMQSEEHVWKLNEIAVTLRVPLADPTFLKKIEDEQRSRSEMMTMSMLGVVNGAEKNYSSSQGHFACSLSVLGKGYLYDPEIAKGTKNGYVYVISGCDGSHYQVVAEPALADSEQRAFCSDESGEIRASSDGKATTCLSSGEVVQKAMGDVATGVVAGVAGGGTTPQTDAAVPSRQSPTPKATAPTRVRVSQGVANGMRVRDVSPVYPPDAKKAGIQGSVVMAAIIGKDGAVQSLIVLNSPSPVLSDAAMDAVKQWKYRPYILNGTPVEVDTTVTVNFTLSR